MVTKYLKHEKADVRTKDSGITKPEGRISDFC